MQPTDEELMAYADGELSGDDERRVAQMIAGDERLAVRVANHRAMRSAARAAYTPDQTGEMSSGLADLMGEIESSLETAAEANVTLLAEVRASRGLMRAAWPAAAAACFVLGIAVSQQLMPPPATHSELYFTWQDERPVAARQLAGLLDNQASGSAAGSAAGQVTINASFIADDGRLCRQFQIDGQIKGETRTGAIACRLESQWQVLAIAVVPAGQDQSYQAAGGANDPLAAAAAQLGVKQKLSPSKEAELIAGGWEKTD